MIQEREWQTNTIRNSIISLICIVFGNVFRFNLPPINFWITQWLLISVSLGFYRFLLRDVYLQLSKLANNKIIKNVAIYGAGAAGSQLYSSLKYSSKYKVNFFIDDSGEYAQQIERLLKK